jgi:hypothetical protein
MSENREFISVEKALKLIGRKKTVHVFLNPRVDVLIGADWPMDDIKNLLSSAETIEIGGEHCVRMGHSVVVTKDREHYFLESKKSPNKGKL